MVTVYELTINELSMPTGPTLSSLVVQRNEKKKLYFQTLKQAEEKRKEIYEGLKL